MNPRPDPIGRALTHAVCATQLDPRNAYARCWLAIVHFFRGENEKFETESQLALRLNPNDPETLADIGHYLAFMGEFERGVELSRRAQELNPCKSAAIPGPRSGGKSCARANFSAKSSCCGPIG